MKFDDQPIQESKEDVLSRSPVAKKLAEGIKNYKQKESFVIGIQGEWGEGKTSFINMILENFQKPELKDKFIVVHFNPWYFTGEDQLLKQFCNIFAEKLKTGANDNIKILQAAKNIKKIATLVKPLKGFVNFAGLSIGVPGIGSCLGASAEKVANFTKDLEEAYQPTEDLIEIKEKIEKALSNFDKKIIVIIDDIDRLNKDEVYEIFRLVKIIADFPKTFYILAYDKKRVSDFLGEKGYDSNFIEKIIQQELNLPSPDKSIIYNHFVQGINDIIKNHNIETNERTLQYFREIDYAGLNKVFQNIRSVNRVLNVIDFESGVLKKEVNFIDLSVLCLLKLYASDVYKYIEKYGENYLDRYTSKDIEQQKIYSDFKNKVNPDERWAVSIIETMFPALGNDSVSKGYDEYFVKEWIKDKRICTNEYFNRYFALSVCNQISEETYTEIYNATHNREDFISILNQYKERKNLRKLLQRLRLRVDNFPKDRISNVISILLDEADYIDEKNTDFFGIDAENQAFFLCLDLLKSLPVKKRLEVFQTAIENTKTSTNSLLRFVDHIGKDHGYIESKSSHRRLETSERFLDVDKFEEYRDFVLKRISDIDIQELFKKQSLAYTWFLINEYNTELAGEIRNKLLKAENGFLKAVSLFCNFVINSDHGRYRKLNFEVLQKFLESKKSEDTLTKEIEKALENSSDTELNQIVKKGLVNAKDPNK